MPTQDQVRDMVNEHVQSNATSLVYNLFSNDQYVDDLWEIMSKPNYESAAYDEGYTVEERPDGFHYAKPEPVTSYEGPYDTELQAWEAACDDNDIESHTDEAYEHWIVSDWLASKLEAKGELITHDFMGLTIWGRCATGQAIYLDYVMGQICAETPRYSGDNHE
jgi:hypothetical protein